MEWFSPRAFFRSSSGIMAPLVCCLVLSGSLASCVAKLISMASKLSRKRRFSSSLMCPNCCVDSSAAAPPARGSARGGASSACILILCPHACCRASLEPLTRRDCRLEARSSAGLKAAGGVPLSDTRPLTAPLLAASARAAGGRALAVQVSAIRRSSACSFFSCSRTRGSRLSWSRDGLAEGSRCSIEASTARSSGENCSGGGG
mmetsp:Transcript_29205/g.96851  ORF Transcript_29205/g.96851 Transcript_29205/m.96851 type:complete len:204 (-) Transcript_29205:675-1286(-)